MQESQKWNQVDLSHLDLVEEPLNTKIISSYQVLAYRVIAQAIEDLMSDDPEVRESAENFCLSNLDRYREMRMLWLDWIQMDEDVLMRAARRSIQLLRRSNQEPN